MTEAREPDPLFVRVAEAARLLSVSTTTLYREAHRGTIPCRHIGGTVVIPMWFVREGGEPHVHHSARSSQR